MDKIKVRIMEAERSKETEEALVRALRITREIGRKVLRDEKAESATQQSSPEK